MTLKPPPALPGGGFLISISLDLFKTRTLGFLPPNCLTDGRPIRAGDRSPQTRRPQGGAERRPSRNGPLQTGRAAQGGRATPRAPRNPAGPAIHCPLPSLSHARK
jgi:hypothetical protein